MSAAVFLLSLSSMKYAPYISFRHKNPTNLSKKKKFTQLFFLINSAIFVPIFEFETVIWVTSTYKSLTASQSEHNKRSCNIDPSSGHDLSLYHEL